MDSIWSQTAKAPEFPTLKQDADTDVLIIGGGLAGILCAHILQGDGVPYILAEASRIGSGTTKNTTAKLTCQHGIFYLDLVKKFGKQTARMYMEANKLAMANLLSLAGKTDCDLERKDAYVYSLDDYKKVEDEYRALTKAGFDCTIVKDTPLPFSVAAALRYKNQAQFHPLKFLYAISQGLHIYENTQIIEISKHKGTYTATFSGGKISARKIIVATHFPFMNKYGGYFIKMYQHRSYIFALENAPNFNGMYVDEDKKGMTFRNYKDLLFVGGGGHRTGKDGGNWAELEKFSRKYFPQAQVKYRWAAQDCMSLDSVPYIGQYSPSLPNIYVASGFNKWGITSSMVAATLLTDMILEKENKYRDIFAPDRSVMRPQLLANGAESVMGLLTPRMKRCPHMGCQLEWNPDEKTWDCPCHGSRFDYRGQLLDGPAQEHLPARREA